MPNGDLNKIPKQLFEITFRHGCFAINLLHTFRTLFQKNTFGELLVIE